MKYHQLSKLGKWKDPYCKNKVFANFCEVISYTLCTECRRKLLTLEELCEIITLGKIFSFFLNKSDGNLSEMSHLR